MRVCSAICLLVYSYSFSFGQELTVIFKSKESNVPVKAILREDSLYFRQPNFWFPIANNTFWAIEKFGIKYRYDFANNTLQKINRQFNIPKKELMNNDFSPQYAHNFYFYNNIIAWRAKSTTNANEVVRYIDLSNNMGDENIFAIPAKLRNLHPIIIDTNRLLIDNYILHVNGQIDTLTMQAVGNLSGDDRIYMSYEAFFVDRFYKNLQMPSGQNNALYFFQIVNGKVVRSTLNIDNWQDWRIECIYGASALLSSKTKPYKFVLWKPEKVVDIELDSAIFNMKKVIALPKERSDQSAPPSDLQFAHMVSMTATEAYFFFFDDGITIYKISLADFK
jgi:hypothetical protein